MTLLIADFMMSQAKTRYKQSKFDLQSPIKMLELNRSRKSSEQSPMVQARKKLLSLKVINPNLVAKDQMRERDQKIFFRLQKSLAKHNLQQQPISDPSPMLPSQENNRKQDRIWNQFSTQSIKVATKIERQKVNFYEKFFLQTKKEFQGYQQARRNCISGLQGAIKEKYRQIHAYFEQIKQQKTAASVFNATAKANKKNKKSQLATMDNNEKIETLKSTIEDLRKQVAQIEKERQILADEEKLLNNQWVYYLQRFLKQGYYLKKGAIPILEELFQMNCKLTLDDMPKCLDDVSKRCLLTQFYKARDNQTPGVKKRVISESNSKMALIAKRDLIKDVYKGTKQFLVSLVKDSSWNEPLILPPIKQSLKLKQGGWQQHERKRLSHMYTGQQYERARSILFGLKVQTSV